MYQKIYVYGDSNNLKKKKNAVKNDAYTKVWLLNDLFKPKTIA